MRQLVTGDNIELAASGSWWAGSTYQIALIPLAKNLKITMQGQTNLLYKYHGTHRHLTLIRLEDPGVLEKTGTCSLLEGRQEK